MRIVVLNPPTTKASNVARDSIYGCWCKGKRLGGTTNPPHPLILIGTILKDNGNIVSVVDAPMQRLNCKDMEIRAQNIDIVVVNSSVMTFGEDADVLLRMKGSNKKLTTIVCGAAPTFMADFCLKHDGIDYVVFNEPDFIIKELIERISSNGDVDNIPGIGFKNNGTYIKNDFAPLISNLDFIPFSDWSMLEYKGEYFNPIIERYPYVTDLTTRGCHGKCTFCMSPKFYGSKVRGRSAQNVIEGFRRHKANGIKEIYLRDEMFTAFKGRNVEIFEAMIKEDMDFTWICSSRVDAVDKDMLALMKRSGCHTIKFGVESGNQEILNRVKKDIDLDDVRKTFHLCSTLKIKTHAHFMVGMPGENKDTLKQTIRFAKEINPTTATFGMMTPYPGTPIFEQIAMKYPDIRNGFSIDLETLHSTSFFTDTVCDLTAEELSQSVLQIHREFYFRLSYLLGWFKRIKSFDDLRRVLKAGIKLFDFSIRGD